MTDSQDFEKQTVPELVDEYMKKHYAIRSIAGEESLDAVKYRELWELFSWIKRQNQYHQNLETEKSKLKETLTQFVKLLMQKLKRKNAKD